MALDIMEETNINMAIDIRGIKPFRITA
ncbi:hypothetical protein CCACVL1_27113 [Corchorus capsularis]|uniref:Uncharacterized protein n=1 Tax=Corchorus capsularis TaxID=210143 RepID=A0A1R3GC68_COCAP|nr:hypothetical protein CCACVL1_27113 [Corchorus capsularis]